MLYQVLLETSDGWALFREPTPSAQQAQYLAHDAAMSFPGRQVRILHASTSKDLEFRCAHWQADHAEQAVGTPEWWHARMDALESGPGADDDQPYAFAGPDRTEIAAAWLHLAARVTRGELGGAHDGKPRHGRLRSAA